MSMEELIQELENLRIDISIDGFGCSSSQIMAFERANRMLDDCIQVVKEFVS